MENGNSSSLLNYEVTIVEEQKVYAGSVTTGSTVSRGTIARPLPGRTGNKADGRERKREECKAPPGIVGQ